VANRVIKDSIWRSKTLARLKSYHQDQWSRWLLMCDDWGCFNADADIIKGTAYPKRKETTNQIKDTRDSFYSNGMLLVWEDAAGQEWGYAVSWDTHQFCNSTGVDEKGKYTKHRRKTPEPPQDKVLQYIKKYCDKFRQVSTKSLKPNPNPIPNPNPKPDNISEQNKVLLDAFSESLRININTYLDRVRLSNKSKVITQGRINTLLTELSKTREHFKNDVDFEYALEQAISRDACNIGYITAIMKNRQTQKPKPKIEKNYDSLIESKLNKIATKDMIKDLMREIPENLWWKIKEYLKKRYPAGGKCYPEAEREMMKCLK